MKNVNEKRARQHNVYLKKIRLKECKLFMLSIQSFSIVIIWLFINISIPIFIFFLAYTVAMGDRAKEPKLPEIIKGVITKTF